jgi:hypothetical protein
MNLIEGSNIILKMNPEAEKLDIKLWDDKRR